MREAIEEAGVRGDLMVKIFFLAFNYAFYVVFFQVNIFSNIRSFLDVLKFLEDISTYYSLCHQYG